MSNSFLLWRQSRASPKKLSKDILGNYEWRSETQETSAAVFCFSQVLTFFLNASCRALLRFNFSLSEFFTPENSFFYWNCHSCTGNSGLRHNPATFPLSCPPKNEWVGVSLQLGTKMRYDRSPLLKARNA